MIIFAVNSGCDWEMLHPWMAVVLGKDFFFFTAGRQNITRIAWFRVLEMSSTMSKEWTLGLSLQPSSLES